MGDNWIKNKKNNKLVLSLRGNRIKSIDEYVQILDACIAEGLHVSRREREKAIEIARKIV